MNEIDREQAVATHGKPAQVLDAARALFVEHGFGASSMDAIAARAGVSKATVYAHYASKQALFAATTRRECRRVHERMALPDDVGDLSLSRALTDIGHSFLQAILSQQNLTLLRMVAAELPRFPELGPIFYDSAPGLTLASVSGYLEQARSHGLVDLPDCRLAAGQFLGALRGDSQIRALLGLTPDVDDAEQIVDAAVAMFVARYAIVTPARDGR
ncbi:transcriptional regulator [Salinisphaera dokdonensis CL-ES53]|uniref:Transcriptional regulator n=1 Tax=Salinisphaera dokdonensis CL-ES53 TaxID=1304272 RepID=A0ABV2B200_9GAMM